MSRRSLVADLVPRAATLLALARRTHGCGIVRPPCHADVELCRAAGPPERTIAVRGPYRMRRLRPSWRVLFGVAAIAALIAMVIREPGDGPAVE